MNEFKILVYPISTLSDTIIGVGRFFPYTLQVGFWVMLGYFFDFGHIKEFNCSGPMGKEKGDIPSFSERYNSIISFFFLIGT